MQNIMVIDSKNETLKEILKRMWSNLPCKELFACFVISCVGTYVMNELIQVNYCKETWEIMTNISSSLAGFILAILVLIYGIGGRLNTDTHPNIFSELTAIISFGVILHLVSLSYSLIMYSLDFCELGYCKKISTVLGIFTFVYSIVYTLNIVIHTYSIHSFFNKPNK